MENFDVIGSWRDWYRTKNGKYVKRLGHPQAPNHHVLYRQGPDVDPSGTLPNGRKFADIRKYKRFLLEDETAMARSLIRLLLTYSLGRRLGFSDRPEVERILARAKQWTTVFVRLFTKLCKAKRFVVLDKRRTSNIDGKKRGVSRINKAKFNDGRSMFDVQAARLSRRTLLRGAGVAIALPALDCMIPSLAASEANKYEPRRMMAINMELSFHPPT